MIYLDNSATTKPCEAAVQAMHEALENGWFNPSAAYGPAVRAEKRMWEARELLANAAGAKPDWLVFTASGSEADSLAILGSAARFHGAKRVLLFGGRTSGGARTKAQLEAMGHTVETFGAGPDGVVDLPRIASMLDEHVALLSCMQVNNETGAIQPIEEIARLLKQANPQALDACGRVQGFLRVPFRMERSLVDLYSVSAHKIHGPKGVAALFVREGVRIAARVEGGGQEHALRFRHGEHAWDCRFCRCRTVDAFLPGARAGAARGKDAPYMSGCAGRFRCASMGRILAAESAAPHILNLSLGVRGEVLLHALEQEGVYVGTGSACSSKKREMSAAFRAMGAQKSAAETRCALSIGMMNTLEEADEAAQAVLRCLQVYGGVSKEIRAMRESFLYGLARYI